MTKKSIQKLLEFTFLQNGPLSSHLLNSVLMNFIDELEESLHDDADDALICVVAENDEVAMLIIEWDGTVRQNEKAFERLKEMWKPHFAANMAKLIPVFVEGLSKGMLGVAGVKWIENPSD